MKIVLLTGNAPNQKALANKVAAEFNLVGLVIEKKPGKKQKLTLGRLMAKLKDIFLFSRISQAWVNLLRYYDHKYPVFPSCDNKIVDNINESKVIDFIKEKNPELVMVSGTSLIKKPFFQVTPLKGIVNLHTGLSPYIKGGPNCTNWCLATNQFHLIGNTIMWLDAGIDSGNIITTELVNFTGEESLNDIHLKVMEDAHSLYLRALRLIDFNPSLVPSVNQTEINKGTLFLTKMWNDEFKLSLLKNIKNGRFKSVIKSVEYKNAQKNIITVPLPNTI
jgi:folate-dependent phosphoribosylglycinamide formyltransferase PurN